MADKKAAYQCQISCFSPTSLSTAPGAIHPRVGPGPLPKHISKARLWFPGKMLGIHAQQPHILHSVGDPRKQSLHVPCNDIMAEGEGEREWGTERKIEDGETLPGLKMEDTVG